MQNPTSLRRHRFVFLSAFTIASLLVAALYLPGLHGPFLFDDEVNIALNPAVTEFAFTAEKIRAIADQDRPLAIASLALNWWAGGGESAYQFKLANLLIHLINASLIFWLLQLLAGVYLKSHAKTAAITVRWFPAIGATLWALHPIQITSVLYVVQRMTSLSATCVLAGLIAFIYGRLRLARHEPFGRILMFIGIVGATVLGFGFKENAVLLTLYVAVIEFIFFRHTWNLQNNRKRLLYTYAWAIAALTAFVLFWLSRRVENFNIYTLREFTMTERLLTESRVIWFYVSLILLPQFDRFSLFHDDFVLSTGLSAPLSTPFAIAGVIAAVVLSLRFSRRAPMLCFAILWFLVGHSLESSFIGLELVHEHRNYLPSLGLIAAVAYGLSALIARANTHRVFVVTLTASLIAGVGLSTAAIAETWSDEQRLAEFMLQHHPRSARAHTMLADMYYFEKQEPIPAMRQYSQAAEIEPHETALPIRIVTIGSMTQITSAPSERLVIPEQIKELAEETGNEVATFNGYATLRATPARLEMISAHLETYPIHARTSTALNELVDCIVQYPRQCGYLLDEAIRWHEIAVHQARTAKRSLPGLYLSLVRLYLEKKNYVKARDAAHQALILDPHNSTLALMEVNVLQLSGAAHEAEQALAEIRMSYKFDTEQRELADTLERALTQERHAIGGARRGSTASTH